MRFLIGKIVFFLGVLVCGPIASVGQGGAGSNFVVSSLAENKGLNSWDISALYQDRNGYIWVGNKPGISRFDGYEFQNFTEADGVFIGQIHAITEVADGTLWIGGENGLFFFENGAFHAVPLHKELLRVLHYDQNQLLWIGGFGFIPFRLNNSELNALKSGRTPRAEPIVSQEEWVEKVVQFRVWTIDTDRDGTAWLGVANRRISFDGKNLEVHWADNRVFQKHVAVAAFHRDSIFWGTEETGTALQRGAEFYPVTESISYIFTVTDSACYFLTQEKLLKLKDGQMTTLHTFDAYRHLYFQNMILDREGNFWIGAVGNLIKLTPSRFRSWSNSDSPLLNANFSIAQARDGQILIGSNQARIISLKNDRLSQFAQLPVSAYSVTQAIYPQENGWNWYATSLGGIVLERNGQYERYGTEEGLADNGQALFFKGKDGQFYCGGDGGLSLILIDENGQISFQNFLAKQPGREFIFPVFNAAVEGPDGTIWATSDKGLYRLKDRQLKKWTLPATVSPSPILTGIEIDDDGRVWMGSQGEGLWQCHFNEHFEIEIQEQWRSEDGLLSDVILDLHIDRLNRIWVVSQDGICRISPAVSKSDDAIQCFDERDGWLTAPTARCQLLEDKDHLLWALSTTGINVFPVYQTSKNEIRPQTFINKVELFDGKEDIYEYAKNSTNPQLLPQQLTLPHNKNFLRFHFTTTSHTIPGKNKFRYQLVGLDRDWNEAGATRSIPYSGLRPGTYTFKVLAANNRGTWGEEPAIFQFQIVPPIWATLWARLLYILFFVAVIVGVYRFQIGRKLALAESRRLKEVNELKNSLYTNITHEFRTPLTVILGMTDALQTNAKEKQWDGMEKSLEMIRRNSHNLLALINRMLSLSKLETSQAQFNFVHADIAEYLRYLWESFSSLGQQKKIQMKVILPHDPIYMDFDPQAIQQIFSNLLSNALKFTPEGGRVVVQIDQKKVASNRLLVLKVTDTGKGIEEEELPHIFDRFYQADPSVSRNYEGTGIGLALTKELIDQLRGVIFVRSTPKKGSEFEVRIPIQMNHEPQAANLAQIKQQQAGQASLSSGGTPNNSNLPLLLIIEDNIDVVHYLRLVLSKHYQCLHAKNGKTGLEMAFEQIPDIIISDVMMPELDGFELCHLLKSDDRTDHIPIVMLTARTDQEARLTGLATGADAYLAKPFEKEELIIRLEKLMELRHRLQQKYALHQIAPEGPGESFLLKLKNIMLERLNEETFSPDNLAEALHLSRSQVHRKIKALTGQSTSIYMRSIRMDRAKELLRSSSLTVSEIAYQVGFKSPVYFSQIFKQTYGKSPSESRAMDEKRKN